MVMTWELTYLYLQTQLFCWVCHMHAYKWRKCHHQWSHTCSVTGLKRLVRIQSCERLSDGLVHSSVKCCCFVGKSSWKSHTIIFNKPMWRRERKRKEKKNILAVCQLSGSVLSQCFFVSLGVLFVVKILKDEWYVVIRFTIFEIILYYHILRICPIPTYIESTNCMMSSQLLTHIIIH